MAIRTSSETYTLITRAFDAAWADIARVLAKKGLEPEKVQSVIIKRLVEAVNRGERDEERLKAIALQAIDAQRAD